MKPLIIHPRAAKDAREIAAIYADVSDELCDQFWKEIDDAIDIIERHPERHHYDPSGRRRSNLKRFPYYILFEERLECNRIIVILHTGFEGYNRGAFLYPEPLQGAFFVGCSPGVVVATLLDPGLRSVILSGLRVNQTATEDSLSLV